MSVLLYRSTTWTPSRRTEKMPHENYTRMLCAVLNKTWKQHPSKQQLYGHLHLISETIKVKRIRHAGHRWRSKDGLISDILLWNSTHGHTNVGRPGSTYIEQLCADIGYILEDLLEVMNNRDRCERKSGNSVLSTHFDNDD